MWTKYGVIYQVHIFNCFQRRATVIAVVVRGVHSSNVSAALEELADGRNNDNYDITMRFDRGGNRHYHKFTSNLNAGFLNLKPERIKFVQSVDAS